MATARDSQFYTDRYTTKYPVPVAQGGSTIVRLPWELTVVSAAAASDTYNLCKIPAGATVVGAFATTNGLGASAGAGCTLAVGDSTTAARLIAATDFDASGAQAHLATAGMNYQYTAETTILATIGTGTPVVGQVAHGFIDILMF